MPLMVTVPPVLEISGVAVEVPAAATALKAQLAQQGKIGPDETVVAIISGNGLKTIQDHPDKAWPEMVACNLESMGAMLEDFRRTAATV